METSKVANWLQILANFGIIAGLILVAIQINQNTKIASADFRSRGFEIVAQYQLAMIGENPSSAVAKAATNPDDLTDEELLILRRIFSFWVNVDSRRELDIEAGFRTKEPAVKHWQDRAESVYGANSVWAAIWEQFRDDPDRDYEWISVVDKRFRQIEHNTDQKLIDRLRKAIDDEP